MYCNAAHKNTFIIITKKLQIINDMNDGKFVDDEIVNKLIENVIFDQQRKNKLIFDGYPRSLTQAKNLDILLNKSNQKIDFILLLNVNKETITKVAKSNQRV